MSYLLDTNIVSELRRHCGVRLLNPFEPSAG
jgi:predicted nucleic acid-binding protein